jgi:hypothetical protein
MLRIVVAPWAEFTTERSIERTEHTELKAEKKFPGVMERLYLSEPEAENEG